MAERVSMIRQFLDEKGGETPVTQRIEVETAKVLGSQNPREVLRVIRDNNPEEGLLVAHQLIGEDVEDIGLQDEVLVTFETGINRAEPDQLPDRLRMLGNLTGRAKTGHTWADRERVITLTSRVLESNSRRVPLGGSAALAKIQSDLL